MQITKVRIQNFRCHVDTEISFQNHHALVGINSSGKTAVLEAIQIALAGGRTVSEHDFNNLDRDSISIEVEFNQYFIAEVPDGYQVQKIPCNAVKCEIKRRERAAPNRLLSDPFRTTSYAIPVLYNSTGGLDHDAVPDEVQVSQLPATIRKTAEGYEAIRRSTGNSMPIRRDKLTLSLDTAGLPNVFYFGRDREKQAKSGFNTTFSRILKELNWRYRKEYDEGQTAAPPAEPITSAWNPYYEKVMGHVGRRADILDAVRADAESLCGRPLAGLELSLLDIEQPFANAFWAIREGANQIEVDETGSGLSVLLAFCLISHISRHSKEEVVFLIDEPELHLHPELQKRLFKALRKLNNQVIYTTHSPFFIDLGDWRGTTRFEHGGAVHPLADALANVIEGRSVREHLDDIRAGRYHESAFIESDAQVLLSQRVLLVEGPADKHGLPRLAEKLKKDWSALTIVECHGKTAICQYALLCLAYGVDAFVVFDLDGNPETEQENADVIKAIHTLPHAMFATSLETLFGVGSGRTAFKLLEKIDRVEPGAIPLEVQHVIAKVTDWYAPQKVGVQKNTRKKRKPKPPAETAGN